MINFITKAQQTHGDRYDYSKVIYTNAATKVEIICRVHGSFLQRPNNHTSHRQGCPLCENSSKAIRNRGRALSKETFVERAQELYGSVFDYSDTIYVASHSKIQIRCKTHGIFTIARAEKHLKGQSCPTCSNRVSQGEQIVIRVLKDINIHHIQQAKFDGCRSPFSHRHLPFDFFVPSRNVLIEFDGEQHFKRSPLFHPGDRFEKFRIHDQVKNNFAKRNGFVLFRYIQNDLQVLGEKLRRDIENKTTQD